MTDKLFSVNDLNHMMDKNPLKGERQNLLKQLADTMRENERLRDALAIIELSSHGCPVILDYETVPQKYQDVIRDGLRGMGRIASEALSNKESDNG